VDTVDRLGGVGRDCVFVPGESSINRCCSVIVRWWLVAGLLNVRACDLDSLETVPLRLLSDVCLFTSLFGGNCVGLSRGEERIGAAEV